MQALTEGGEKGVTYWVGPVTKFILYIIYTNDSADVGVVAKRLSQGERY